MINSLLDDLSRTDDSAEAARKAKLLRELVSGVPVTPEEVEKAAYHIVGTPEYERLEADLAIVKRSHKVALVWSLCSVAMIVAGLAWLYVSGASSVAAKFLWILGVTLSVLNGASLVTDYLFIRFARNVKRINDEANR